MVGHVTLGRMIKRFGTEWRLAYSLTFSLLFLLIMHGFNTFKIIGIVYVNYVVTTSFPKSRVSVGFAWTWSLLVLYLNHLYQGFAYADLHPALAYLVCSSLTFREIHSRFRTSSKEYSLVGG